MISRMRKHWPLVRFKEVVAHSAFGPRFSGELYSEAGNVATLRTTDLRKSGEISYSSMPLAQIDENRFANHFLRVGDLVISRSGRIGTTAVFKGFELPVLPGAFLIRFRLCNDALPEFYRYFFNSATGQALIRSVARGTAQQNINISNVELLRVPRPPTREQEEIVDTLSAYDEQIENNRQRIGLLEEAARMLYREWFVHFHFPGHEQAKIVDGIPEGWKRLALSDLADFVNGYPFKPAQLGDAGLPIVKIPELKHGVTEKTPRNPGDLIPEKYHLKDGDLLFSWSGTLAVNVWASGPALLNQHLFHVIPRNRAGRAFLMCALRQALADFNNQTVGATMKHIRRSALDRVFVALPDGAKMSMVDQMLQDTYAQLVVLHQQSQKLVQARDLLMPRLMNGEIAV